MADHEYLGSLWVPVWVTGGHRNYLPSLHTDQVSRWQVSTSYRISLCSDIVKRNLGSRMAEYLNDLPLVIQSPGPVSGRQVGSNVHALALAPPSHKDGVVSATLVVPSDGVRRSGKAGCTEPALEGPLRACRPYGKRAVWP